MDLYVTLAGLGLGCVLFGSMIYIQHHPPKAYWGHMVPSTPLMIISVFIVLIALVHLMSLFGLKTGGKFGANQSSSSFRELKEDDLRKFMWPVVAVPAALGTPDAPLAQNTELTKAKPAANLQTSAWKRECQGGAGTSAEFCFVRQFVRTKKGQTVLVVTVGMVQGFKNEARAVLTTPLNVSLIPGLAIKIDKKDQEQFKFSDCSRNGCRAFVPLKNKRLDEFKKGAIVRVGWKMRNNKPMVVPIDLRGFSAAISSLAK